MRNERCSGPVSRREFLRVGGLALGGLGLADVLAGKRRTLSDTPGPGGKIAYDQFAWFPPTSGLPGALRLPVTRGDTFEWDKHILDGAPSKEYRISDHLPIWLELSVREN